MYLLGKIISGITFKTFQFRDDNCYSLDVKVLETGERIFNNKAHFSGFL